VHGSLSNHVSVGCVEAHRNNNLAVYARQYWGDFMKCDACRRELDNSKIDHHSKSGINTCKDYADCCRYRKEGVYLQMAEELIDMIIKGLIHTECVQDKEHGCLTVWSAVANEQIAAFLADKLKGRM
jgi:hypothetical protein